jgi:hypothetical protein
MIPQYELDYWQNSWRLILDMAYYRKDIVTIFAAKSKFDVALKNEPDFEKLTFDYVWKEYSRDKDGKVIEPSIVPELVKLTVPYDLFYCLGVSSFMKTCFPNCEINYID